MFWYYVLMFEDEAKEAEYDKTHMSAFDDNRADFNNDKTIEILKFEK